MVKEPRCRACGGRMLFAMNHYCDRRKVIKRIDALTDEIATLRDETKTKLEAALWESAKLRAERDVARRRLDYLASKPTTQAFADLEARLNEAREAVKRYLYALSVNNGTDGPDDRAAALDNLASISDTEGASDG